MQKNYYLSNETALAGQRLAREQMKLKLLADIRIDLQVCEIEGWDKMEYINELFQMLDNIKNNNIGAT